MALQVVKQLNYDRTADTILGISRKEFLKLIDSKIQELLSSPNVERAYTDLPENVEDWFDADGTVEAKLKPGVSCDYKTLDDINRLLFEISNEDGIVVITEDDDTWKKGCLFVPEEKAYANYRRIK